MCRKSLKGCESKTPNTLKDLFPHLILYRRKELAKHIMKNLEINPTTHKLYSPNSSKTVKSTIRTDQLSSLFFFSFVKYKFRDECLLLQEQLPVQAWETLLLGSQIIISVFPLTRSRCCIFSELGWGGSGDSSLC